LPASIVTNAAGIASFTYTSSTTVGFCAITATEAQQGAKGTATVDQVTVVAPSSSYNITVIASPPTIPANSPTTPSSTSTVTATVTGVATAPVVGDEVMFTLTGTNCGLFTAGGDTIVPGPTGLEAFSATVADGTTTPLTYTASTTPGSCTVSVQEANQAQVNSTVITQTPVGYVVTLAASPVTLPAGAAGTANRSTLTAHVTLNGVATNGDLVVFAFGTNEPALTCGTLPAVAISPGVPTVNGVATVTYYQGSSTVGFCGITATETATGASATTYVTENSGQSTANVNTALAVSATISANGTSTSSVTATVLGASSSAVVGDEVMFSLNGPTGVCGTFTGGLTTVFDVTGAGGVTPVQTYTSTTVPGVCTVTVTEANTDVVNTATITQTPVVDGLTLSATPAYLTGNGLTASLITASVTYPAGGVMPGATVTFSLGACYGTLGTPVLSALTAVTGSLGTASVTYTSSVGAGFCIVDASVGTAPTANTASVQIDQTSV
jgi:adhesin/invasin